MCQDELNQHLSASETESLASTIILPFLICTPRQPKGKRIIGQDRGNFSEIKTANVPPLDRPHTGQIIDFLKVHRFSFPAPFVGPNALFAGFTTENIKNF